MSNPTVPNQTIPESDASAEASESFSDMLSQYEKSHLHKREDGGNR